MSNQSEILLEETLSLNKKIFEESFFKYDLGNFYAKKHILNQPIADISDPDRGELLRILNSLDNNPEAFKAVKNVLTRDILYFGSECESLGLINIENEFSELNDIIKNQFLTISKTEDGQAETLIQTWDILKPEIIFFSCHGSINGLFIQSDKGDCYEHNNFDFADFFKKRTNYTECVILSSCESIDLGKLITYYGKNVIAINKRVDISTAHKFNLKFFEYLNNHSLGYKKVYREAYDYATEIIQFNSLPDSFSFEFLQAKQIF